ncbi:MAG: leucine--tRNA ligase [Candidatus Shapirobacteria bacterium]|nr:leucine--tRNA ligase [Candidatus Shapirobacteria bacterium]
MVDKKKEQDDRFQLDFDCWEKFWAKQWQEKSLYQGKDFDKKKKKYILVEFPYPSGSGLHIGHTFTMTGADVYARKTRMAGSNVLFPMGWDAFGLPTENYAIRTSRKPQDVSRENTDNFKRQMKKMAFSFDWEREINTTTPNYYRWTQWIFIQLFKMGLAFKEAMPINWCPDCKIGLANEEVVDDRCERCGAQVSRRKLNQWIVKITDYADQLIKGLEKTDFIDKVKAAQVNWIGKSKGARVKFSISDFQSSDKKNYLEVFTTRPDTLWGATFMVISPEHSLIGEILSFDLKTRNKFELSKSRIQEIEDYIERAKRKSDLERADLAKEKTGVFTGLYAINPVNRKKIPIWISDFVLESYGTGAIMAVPAHDERDWQFAKKFDLPIIPVIKPAGNWDFSQKAYTEVDRGRMINSDFIDNFTPDQAIKKIIAFLEKEQIGRKAVNYHLRDWIFSRQHYWGEPIPMIFCAECAQNIKVKTQNWKLKDKEIFEKLKEYATKEGIDINILINNPGWYPVLEEDLPVELPQVEKYEPTDTGESPLANILNWKKTKCPCCGGEAERETDTMPNWAGSDWYYLAYCFANRLKDSKQIKSKSKIKSSQDIFSENKDVLGYWLPVDVYIGGDEHNTLHLLYSRFIYQFLYDLDVVPKQYPEPYYRRISHGVILGDDGQRMSKSRDNVINPDDKWQKYGVDTLRTYLMFMGPFEATMVWNENALKGVERFLIRFSNLIKTQAREDKKRIDNRGSCLVHQLVLKVTKDIDNFSYNTAIAAMMENLNTIFSEKLILKREDLGILIKLLAPFAPYLTEELWCRVLKKPFSVHQQSWPKAQKKYLIVQKNTIIVQINGRLKGKIDMDSSLSMDKDRVILIVKKDLAVKKHLLNQKIKKIVFIPGKLINFVVLKK